LEKRDEKEMTGNADDAAVDVDAPADVPAAVATNGKL
jgi:hypothetical protein